MSCHIYQCNQCEKSFKSSQSLNSHMRIHSNKKRIYKKKQCPTCNKNISIRYCKNHLDKRKNCLHCNKLFCYKNLSQIFCSSSCFSTYNNIGKTKTEKTKNKIRQSLTGKQKTKRINAPCSICGSNVIIKETFKKTVYCKSAECTHKKFSNFGRKAASILQKRSKDEISLCQLCESFFQNISHNKPIANGWDADILLEDYQIAILWNGPWHYKEMGLKNHSLKQVQNRDKIKIKEFENIGWTVLVYEDRYYTPETAFEDIKNVVATPGIEPGNSRL